MWQRRCCFDIFSARQSFSASRVHQGNPEVHHVRFGSRALIWRFSIVELHQYFFPPLCSKQSRVFLHTAASVFSLLIPLTYQQTGFYWQGKLYTEIFLPAALSSYPSKSNLGLSAKFGEICGFLAGYARAPNDFWIWQKFIKASQNHDMIAVKHSETTI